MVERDFIGEGNSHKVFRHPYNPERVIKKPKFLNSLFLFLTGLDYRQIQKEIDDSQRLDKYNLPLLGKYHKDFNNYITNQGTVYWIDPVRGFVSRTLDRLGIVKYDDFVRRRAAVRKFRDKILGRD